MIDSALLPARLITLTYDDTAAVASRWRAHVSVLERVAQGDPSAARECIDHFGALVWSIARCLTRTRADAEAAVQEIFADVLRSAARFDPDHGSEEIFIAVIARRRLIDRKRRAAHRDQAWVGADKCSLGWGALGAMANACAEARSARRGIMRLRPELRMVLELGVLQGMSHSDIAHQLQMPLGTVTTLMARGLIKIREFIADRK